MTRQYGPDLFSTPLLAFIWALTAVGCSTVEPGEGLGELGAALSESRVSDIATRCVALCAEEETRSQRQPAAEADCEALCRGDDLCDEELLAMAQTVAERELQTELWFVTSYDHLDSYGSLRTRIYVWGPRGFTADDLTPERLLELQSEDFQTVEVGLRAEMPPIVGYWRGLPFDIVHRGAADAAARRVLHTEQLELAAHHGYGLRPCSPTTPIEGAPTSTL